MEHDETAYLYLGGTPDTDRAHYSVAVPYPAMGGAAFETQRMVDSARNANGELVGRMVGRSVHKQSLSWARISCRKWWELNRWFEDGHFTFYCHLFNHSLGRWETRLYYLGDVKASPYLVDEATGEPLFYRDASFNVIDCGVVQGS